MRCIAASVAGFPDSVRDAWLNGALQTGRPLGRRILRPRYRSGARHGLPRRGWNLRRNLVVSAERRDASAPMHPDRVNDRNTVGSSHSASFLLSAGHQLAITHVRLQRCDNDFAERRYGCETAARTSRFRQLRSANRLPYVILP